jgi:hypothetical protein
MNHTASDAERNANSERMQIVTNFDGIGKTALGREPKELGTRGLHSATTLTSSPLSKNPSQHKATEIRRNNPTQ